MSDTPSTEEFVAGLLAGDRATLGQAITLIESRRPDHVEQSRVLIEAVLPRTGGDQFGLAGCVRWSAIR